MRNNCCVCQRVKNNGFKMQQERVKTDTRKRSLTAWVGCGVSTSSGLEDDTRLHSARNDVSRGGPVLQQIR